jgi:hypothetical protein
MKALLPIAALALVTLGTPAIADATLPLTDKAHDELVTTIEQNGGQVEINGTTCNDRTYGFYTRQTRILTICDVDGELDARGRRTLRHEAMHFVQDLRAEGTKLTTDGADHGAALTTYRKQMIERQYPKANWAIEYEAHAGEELTADVIKGKIQETQG